MRYHAVLAFSVDLRRRSEVSKVSYTTHIVSDKQLVNTTTNNYADFKKE